MKTVWCFGSSGGDFSMPLGSPRARKCMFGRRVFYALLGCVTGLITVGPASASASDELELQRFGVQLFSEAEFQPLGESVVIFTPDKNGVIAYTRSRQGESNCGFFAAELAADMVSLDVAIQQKDEVRAQELIRRMIARKEHHRTGECVVEGSGLGAIVESSQYQRAVSHAFPFLAFIFYHTILGLSWVTEEGRIKMGQNPDYSALIPGGRGLPTRINASECSKTQPENSIDLIRALASSHADLGRPHVYLAGVALGGATKVTGIHAVVLAPPGTPIYNLPPEGEDNRWRSISTHMSPGEKIPCIYPVRKDGTW